MTTTGKKIESYKYIYQLSQLNADVKNSFQYNVSNKPLINHIKTGTIDGDKITQNNVWKNLVSICYSENRLLVNHIEIEAMGDSKISQDNLWKNLVSIYFSEKRCIPTLNYLVDFAVITNSKERYATVLGVVHGLFSEFKKLDYPASECVNAFLMDIEISMEIGMEFSDLDCMLNIVAGLDVNNNFYKYISCGETSRVNIKKIEKKLEIIRLSNNKNLRTKKMSEQIKLREKQIKCLLDVVAANNLSAANLGEINELLETIKSLEALSKSLTSIEKKISIVRCVMVFLEKLYNLSYKKYVYNNETKTDDVKIDIDIFDVRMSDAQIAEAQNQAVNIAHVLVKSIPKKYANNKEILVYLSEIQILKKRLNINNGTGCSVNNISAAGENQVSSQEIVPSSRNVLQSVTIENTKERMTIIKDFISSYNGQNDVVDARELLLSFYVLECFVEIDSRVGKNADLFWGGQFARLVGWYIGHIKFFYGKNNKLDTSRCPYRYLQPQIDKYTGYEDTESARKLDRHYIRHIDTLENLKQMCELTQNRKWSEVIRLYDLFISKSNNFREHFQVLLSLSDAYWFISGSYYQKSIKLAKKVKESMESILSSSDPFMSQLLYMIKQHEQEFEKLNCFMKMFDSCMDITTIKRPVGWFFRGDLVCFIVLSLTLAYSGVYKTFISSDSHAPPSHSRTAASWSIVGCLVGVGTLYLSWLNRPRPFKLYS